MRQEAGLDEKYALHVNRSIPTLLKFMGIEAAEALAEGVYLYDANGKRYLDCLGGFGVFNLGHRRPEVVAAVKAQLDQMPLSAKVFLQKPLADLSEALTEVLPGRPAFSFVVNSGAEAVEGALKLARLYTGRPNFVAALRSFHGKTFGALSATGRDLFRAPFQPLLPGFSHVPYGDTEAVRAAVDENTAAVILEPIQGEGGVIIPPDGYLAEVKKICEAQKSLLILDEVQTGFGRTGTLFAAERDAVAPDITVTAKALGGGVMPVGAFSASEKIWEPYQKYPYLHTSTFGGNPLACAAALTTIQILRKEFVSYHVKEKGERFLRHLCELQRLYPDLVADVRGRGLMIGMEFKNEAMGGWFMTECLQRGLLIAYTLNNPQTVRFEPPLVISEDEIDMAAELAAEALAAVLDAWK